MSIQKVDRQRATHAMRVDKRAKPQFVVRSSKRLRDEVATPYGNPNYGFWRYELDEREFMDDMLKMKRDMK